MAPGALANPDLTDLDRALLQSSTPIVIRLSRRGSESGETAQIFGGTEKRNLEGTRRWLAEISEHFGRKDPVLVLADPDTEIGWLIQVMGMASQSHDTVIPLVYGASRIDPILQLSTRLVEGENTRDLVFGPPPAPIRVGEQQPTFRHPPSAQEIQRMLNEEPTILHPPSTESIERMLGK